VGYGTTLAFVWILIRGTEPTLSSIFTGLIQGMLVGLPLAYFFRNFYSRSGLSLLENRYTYIYLFSFLKSLAISNLTTSYRVLSPGMPISPDVKEVKLGLENRTAVAVLANSLTLTPGTLALDYDEDEKILLVHCLNSENEDEMVEDVKKWEKMLEKIFEGDRK
jgi:multicomponent Na+:H+ antiporter subunit E